MGVNNLVAVFDQTAIENSERISFRFVEDGQWTSVTWCEVRERVQKIAGGLRALGLKKGDRVSIMSKTRYEWTLADLGILAAGCIVVPIYESSTAEQLKFICENSEAHLIFVAGQSEYERVISVQAQLPKLKQIVSFDDLKSIERDEGVYTLESLMMLGSENGSSVYQESLANIKCTEDASFVYTSGTTGDPKGAILSHENFMSELDAAMKVFSFEKDYEGLVFLPFSHILARVVQFFQIKAGFIQCYAESIDKLIDNIAEVRPHFMASVPRIFEKIYARTLQGAESGSAFKKKVFDWALDVGQKRSRLILNKQTVPLALNAQYNLAKRLVFSKLDQKLGGRIQFFISGGAPLAADIASFFHAFGFEIFEGYGLTETTAAIAINQPGHIKFGSVGFPIDGVDIKIAHDGEILAKGKMIFKGYYKDNAATQEVIDREGWFHTGDIGQFDEEGFLKITDRKKDIIVTAAGKNVAPQNIENIMKTDPYISQFVVHGDKRKFLSALVTLDRDQIIKYAKENKIEFRDYGHLVSDKKIYEFIKARIDGMNQKLARYETIKRFAILENDFSIESGELTPSLKVKRKIVSHNYRGLLDRFYE